MQPNISSPWMQVYVHIFGQIKARQRLMNASHCRTEAENHTGLSTPTQCRLQEVGQFRFTEFFDTTGNKDTGKYAQTLVDIIGFLEVLACYFRTSQSFRSSKVDKGQSPTQDFIPLCMFHFDRENGM